jgi:hypothetical protein
MVYAKDRVREPAGETAGDTFAVWASTGLTKIKADSAKATPIGYLPERLVIASLLSWVRGDILSQRARALATPSAIVLFRRLGFGDQLLVSF